MSSLHKEGQMSKNFGILSIGLITLLLACSFQFALAQEKISDDKIRSIATEEVSSILKGIDSKDYGQFSKGFSDQMKKAETAEKFGALVEKLDKGFGKLGSPEYMGFYTKGASIITLFKAKSSLTKDDVVIKLVLNLKENEQKVAGLWFD